MDFQIILLILLVMLSGFFSASETALMSLSNIKVHQLFEKKKNGSRALKALKDQPHRLIVTLLVGNNIVNISASAIATSLAITYFGNYGIGIATGIMTLVILIFGEICPKGIAMKNSEKISLAISGIILFLRKMLFPLVFVLDFVTHIIVSVVVGKSGMKDEPLVTEEELKDIVTLGEKEGSINTHEKMMIDNIFELNDTVVGEIMTPRTDMFAVNGNNDIEKVIDDFVKHGFTRVPVFEKIRDNIIGVVQISDILNAVYKKKTKKKLKLLREPVKFVPETKKVDELLRELQKDKEHMAIVIDEFGGVSGVVTLEDLIEEIVGEIYDKDETNDEHIKKINDKEFSLKGDANIDDVNEEIGLSLESSENVNTISGIILEKLGRFPRKKEKIDLDGVEFQIIKIVKHRIRELKVLKK